MPVVNVQELIRNRVEAIKAYHEEAGIQRAQLDVSGGVDSAVMLGLLARAVGPENITAVYSSINSSDDSHWRALDAAKAFGVELVAIDLTWMFDRLLLDMGASLENAGYNIGEVNLGIERDPTILGSMRSTLRAPIGRGFNRLTGGGIRHGTGNECEDRWLRFYQKGGDGEVDTNPIAMLSKGEVYQLAVALGVPESILKAVPSPDLHNNGETHNDEDELYKLYGVGWTYSKVNLEGAYTEVGTIERMSRFMDPEGEKALGSGFTEYKRYRGFQMYFGGYTYEEFEALLKSAMEIERATRHKHNPNCPTLGTRNQLVKAGILTNNLPVI